MEGAGEGVRGEGRELHWYGRGGGRGGGWWCTGGGGGVVLWC